MRKLSVIVLAILMAVGLSTAASAAPTLSFDIDFYQDGIMDTGSTIDLLLGNTVVADIYFSVTEEPVVGGGYDLRFDQSNLSAEFVWFYPGVFLFEPPMLDTDLSRIEPGHVYAEAFVVPPGTSTFGAKFGSIALTCNDISLDELWLFDFNPVTAQWVTTSDLVLDDQLLDGYYLASVNNYVPIPGAVWLLGSGLLGLFGLKRKMKS